MLSKDICNGERDKANDYEIILLHGFMAGRTTKTNRTLSVWNQMESHNPLHLAQ